MCIGKRDLRQNAAVAGRIIQHSTFLDEADEVYRTLRALIQPYLCEINEGACIPNDKNYSTYFVTATHEGLLILLGTGHRPGGSKSHNRRLAQGVHRRLFGMLNLL